MIAIYIILLLFLFFTSMNSSAFLIFVDSESSVTVSLKWLFYVQIFHHQLDSWSYNSWSWLYRGWLDPTGSATSLFENKLQTKPRSWKCCVPARTYREKRTGDWWGEGSYWHRQPHKILSRWGNMVPWVCWFWCPREPSFHDLWSNEAGLFSHCKIVLGILILITFMEEGSPNAIWDSHICSLRLVVSALAGQLGRG